MSEPGPETRWFDVGAAGEAGESGNKTMRVLGIIAAAVVFLPGLVMPVVLFAKGESFVTKSGTRISGGELLVGVLCVMVFIASCAVFGVWLRRKQRQATPEAPVPQRLGIGQAGLWWTAADGATHVGWDAVEGVRIHSVLQSRGGGGGGAAQLISVDLMGAVPPEAAGRAPAFNQGAVFLRIGLPEAFGPTRHFPLRLAMDIGLAVRAFRPELWRGFTLDSGHGYVEFLSWDNAVPPMFPGFQTPTWNNFGGGRQSGPPR